MDGDCIEGVGFASNNVRGKGLEGPMIDRHASRDRELVEQCLNGSEEAWSEFYCRYIGLVRAVLARRSVFFDFADSDLEDLSQEVFATLVSALASYDSSRSLPTFVRIVADRMAISVFRKTMTDKRGKRIPHVSHEQCAELGMEAMPCRTPEQLTETAELIQFVRYAFRQLSENCRELLMFKFLEELKYDEISDITKKDPSTLRGQVKRCLDKLRVIWEYTVEPRPEDFTGDELEEVSRRIPPSSLLARLLSASRLKT